MKVASPQARLNVRALEVMYETLWRIAQGQEIPEFDTASLVRNAHGMLKHAETQDRALYGVEFKEAVSTGDRAKLATLHLKLIRAYLGSEAINESLDAADKPGRVGWLRSKIDDETLAAAWNAPGLERKSDRARAGHLHKVFSQKYGHSVATPSSIERRVQRMRKRGWRMAARRSPHRTRKK
jgi:hypothetical protein